MSLRTMRRLKHYGWVGVVALLGACSGPVRPDCLAAGTFTRPDDAIGFEGELLRGAVTLIGRPQSCFARAITAHATVSDPSGLELPVQVLGVQESGGFVEAVLEFRPRQTGPHFAQVTFEPNLGRGGTVFDVASRGAFSYQRAAQTRLNSAICDSAAVFAVGRVLCSVNHDLLELREDAGFTPRGEAWEISQRGARAWTFTRDTLAVWDSPPDGPRTTVAIPCESGDCHEERNFSYVVPSSDGQAVLISSERVLRVSDMTELIRLPAFSLKSSASWPAGSTEVLIALEKELLRLEVSDGGVSRLEVDGTPSGADPFGVWLSNGSTLSHYGFFTDGGLELQRITPPARAELTARIHRLTTCAPVFAANSTDTARGWVIRHDGAALRLEAVPLITQPFLQACDRHLFAATSQGLFEWLVREGP